MHRYILVGVGGYALLNAGMIGLATQNWYDAVPGVAGTGPLNLHFARDVALAFLSSGIALIWSGAKADMTAGIIGAAWLVFHAVFHLWIWAHRGLPFDLIAMTNLTGIQLPAWLAAWSAVHLRQREAAR